MFGCKEEEITVNCRKSPNEELHDLHLSPNILRVTNTRTVRWLGMWRVWGRAELSWGNLQDATLKI
jgi:hypothetical protein